MPAYTHRHSKCGALVGGSYELLWDFGMVPYQNLNLEHSSHRAIEMYLDIHL